MKGAWDDACGSRVHIPSHAASVTRPASLLSIGSTSWYAFLCFVLCLIGILVDSATASLAAATITQTAVSTMVAPVTEHSCSAVTWCANDRNCSWCFKTVRNLLFDSASLHQAALYERRFLEALNRTTACSPASLYAPRFNDTLWEIYQNRICLQIFDGPNSTENGPPFGTRCQILEYACFIDINCSSCLLNLYNNHSHSASILKSPLCAHMSGKFAERLAYTCPGFPTCSWSKLQCNQSETCIACWDKLRDGDGVAASRQCRGNDHSFEAKTMDNLVGRCMTQTQTSCDFFLDRCAEAPNCTACLESIGDVGSGGATDIIQGMSTAFCANVTSYSMSQLVNVFNSCPQYTACQRATILCIHLYPSCLLCLNGSVDDSQCDFVLSENE